MEMSRPTVTWFTSNHEHRLHYLKLGLMRLARRGEITFSEIPAHLGNLPSKVVHEHTQTHSALLRVRWSTLEKLVALDGQDSIFQISPLIESCDHYFVCAYYRKFFESAPFQMALPWQDESEVAYYKKLYGELQEKYRSHFHKARPLVPIGPDMEFAVTNDWLTQRLHNFRYRARKLFTRTLDWTPQHERFERRWKQLLELRESVPKYDAVLKDSLWGWPRHRIALHKKLASLSANYQIRSELNYRKPEYYELGNQPPPDPLSFPMKVGGGVIGNYEQMLASSRLGVFATGFHWGCRNIVTLTWFLGLPVYMDPPVFESIYDFQTFDTHYNRSGDWRELEENLCKVSTNGKKSAKKEMQATFDRIASPEAAANHILSTVLG